MKHVMSRKESIFMKDETFSYLFPALEKAYKEFSPWGLWRVSEIDIKNWELFVDELEKVKLLLNDAPNVIELKNMIGFLWEVQVINFKKILIRTYLI